MEVARNLGLVSVRPRVGIQREPPTSQNHLTQRPIQLWAQAKPHSQFSQLRRAIETVLWSPAAVLLTDDDKIRLRQIVDQARQNCTANRFTFPMGNIASSILPFSAV